MAVSSIRNFSRLGRAMATAGISLAIAVGGALAPATLAPAGAAPAGPTMPAEFDLSRYTPVNPTTFRSLAYADNGRAYFTTGRWMCQIGPQYRYLGCKGHPATAPSGTLGAVISGDQQGPWWAATNFLYAPSYRFGPTSGFRPPLLKVGQRVTIAGVTCTVPRADAVACRTGSRALIFTPGWHKFFFPSGNNAHSPNPATNRLPPPLQYWNQLPAQPAPPV